VQLPKSLPFLTIKTEFLCYNNLISVPLCLGAFVLNRSAFASLLGALGDLYSLIFSLCLRGKNEFAFVISAVHSLTSAESTTAADTRQQSAALAPFQRLQPRLPPPQNHTSADARELPASHFSG